MSKLRRQIKQTERELAQDNACIQQQFLLLKQRINMTKFLVLGLIAGFVTGFIFSYKKTFKQLLRRFIIIPIMLAKLYRSIKPYIPKRLFPPFA